MFQVIIICSIHYKKCLKTGTMEQGYSTLPEMWGTAHEAGGQGIKHSNNTFFHILKRKCSQIVGLLNSIFSKSRPSQSVAFSISDSQFVGIPMRSQELQVTASCDSRNSCDGLMNSCDHRTNPCSCYGSEDRPLNVF